jgi:GT2 family glycosyltransferase
MNTITQNAPTSQGGAKIGIIIINWNSLRLGFAEDLVNSLNAVEYPEDKYTVFVADNLSDDGSPEYIEQNLKNGVVVRMEDNLGFAEANNRLVARCIDEGYEYAYLLNHDTEVTPDFLTQAVTMMESDPEIGAVQSRMMLHQDKGKINSIGNMIHFLGFGFSKGGYEPLENYARGEWNGKEIAYGSGAAVLLKLEVVKVTKLFDTHFFMYHEDLDLGWKIKMAGYKNVLAWDSVIYHKYEFSRSLQKYYYMERNRYIVLFENLRIGTLILLFPFLFAFELGTLLFAFKSGFWKQKLAVYPYFTTKKAWKLIKQHRHEKKLFRQVSDKEILKNFSGTINNQHIDNALLNRIVNPVAEIYFKLVQLVIFW